MTGAGREPSFEALVGMLLGMLRARSGFSADALPAERLSAWLRTRARELGCDEIAAARAALARTDEYARIEAYFAPPETWLFRYPESFELLRGFAGTRRGERVRALVLGAGGWCEPASIACALRAGGAIPEVEAVDRNAAAMARPAHFSGIHVRGGVPDWAAGLFTREGDRVTPVPEVLDAVATRIGDILAVAHQHVARGARFDVVAFRNTSIYLNGEVREAVFRAIATLCAERGLVLVGHSEVQGAAQQLGFRVHRAQGAFALERAERVPEAAGAPAPEHPAPPRMAAPVRRAADAPPVRASAGQRADPIGAARAAIAASPSDASLHLRLACLLDESGDRDGAAEAVQRALYLDRFHEEALMLAARLADARGAAADAERLRQRALRVHLERMRDGERG